MSEGRQTRELPSGTVTFLFTDIEGSTALLKALGRERYGQVLADHQRLMRAALAEWGGHEIDTQGDAFFVAFERAKDAVSAAVTAQRALAAQAWPDGGHVRVRMGLHTGEPSLSEAGFVSLAVNRAARICSAGYGGQVLLSRTTTDLVEDELPGDVGVRDLGEHRLKDLDRPERIFQLVIEGLPDAFPPLRTLESQAARATPFAGREEELAEAAQAELAGQPRRRLVLVLAGLLAALALGAVATVLLVRTGGGGLAVQPNSIAAIDPTTNRVSAEVPVGLRPGELVFGSGSLWVANLDDQTISRVDPIANRVEKTIPTGEAPRGLAAAGDGIWFVSARANSSFLTVRRIAPRFDIVEKTIKVPGQAFIPSSGGGVAAGGRALWVAPQGLGTLLRIDAQTSKVAAIDAGNVPSTVVVASDAVWVADRVANTVTRIDPTNVVTATIPVGRGPTGIAVGAGGVWVATTLDDAVVRIDPSRNAVKTTIPVGRAPVGVAVGAGAVWVANSRDGTVSRIDPEQDKVVATIRVGGSPAWIAVSGERVWVSVQSAALETRSQPAQPGGTARVNAESDIDSADPALARDRLSLQLEYATCAKLLNYPDRPAPAGTQVVPEVARSLATRSADGKRYAFTIRKGFRFSPPSTEPVTAQTFKYSIERMLDPRMRSPARGLASEIVGAEAFGTGRAKHLAGVTAAGDTLTIRLAEPVPDFPARMADPAFCAVPTDTPIDPKGVRSLPSAGPYYLDSYVPGQGVLLKRNPNYGGGRPQHLEAISLRLGIAKAQTVAQIEAGAADYAADEVPGSEHARLAARYGPGSPAAKAGKQQYFVDPILQLDWLELNESRPLFADVRVRRAVNYAIDRRALARQVGTALAEFPAEPTDQYLPPGMPGFRDVNAYPLTPDVARAQRLMGGQRAKAVLYVCNLAPCPQLAQIIGANLGAIGIDVEVRALSLGQYFSRIQRRGEPFDIAIAFLQADTPDPGRSLARVFSLKLLYGTKTSLERPAYKRKLDAAARLYGPRRYLAFGALDADLTRNDAPVVAFSTDTVHDFFSARMGCQIYNPVYGMDLAALCIRR
jgi:YVTN family beta-propeller protein